MSAIIVDASVGVKWFVPEVHAAEARQWRSGPDELHAPAFFFDLEIANILWKKMRRGEITRADSDLILGQLPALPLTRHPEEPLVIGYCCGQHQDEAAPLVQRFASALGYELTLE